MTSFIKSLSDADINFEELCNKGNWPPQKRVSWTAIQNLDRDDMGLSSFRHNRR